MKRLLYYSILGLYTYFHLHANSVNADTLNRSDIPWTTWKENAFQHVKYRPVIIDNKELLEISTSTLANSSLSSFLFFLLDTNNTPTWVSNASESKNLNINSQPLTVNSFYIKMKGLWPLKPRILVLQSIYWQNSDLSIEIQMKDIEPLINAQKDYFADTELTDYVKIKTYYAHWKITPIARPNIQSIHQNEILIQYTYIADGRGDTPTWLAEHLSLKSIWKSMHNLRRELPLDKWQKHKLKGINELSDRYSQAQR